MMMTMIPVEQPARASSGKWGKTNEVVAMDQRRRDGRDGRSRAAA